jgi:hypothetical protein
MTDAAQKILDTADEQGLDRDEFKSSVASMVLYDDGAEEHAAVLEQYAEQMVEARSEMTKEEAARGLVDIIKAEDHDLHRDPQTTWDRADAALEAFLS